MIMMDTYCLNIGDGSDKLIHTPYDTHTFIYTSSFKRAIISGSVRKIESGALSKYYNLKHLIIPDTVDTVEKNIFNLLADFDYLYIPKHIIPQLSDNDKQIYENTFVKMYNKLIDDLIDK